MQVCEPRLHTLGRKAPCTVLVLEDVTLSKLETDMSMVTQDQGENLSLWTPQPRAFLLACHPVIQSAQGLKQCFSEQSPRTTSEGIPPVWGDGSMLIRT